MLLFVFRLCVRRAEFCYLKVKLTKLKFISYTTSLSGQPGNLPVSGQQTSSHASTIAHSLEHAADCSLALETSAEGDEHN